MKLGESLTTFLPSKLGEIFAKKIVSGSFFIVAVGSTIYETDRMPYNFTIPISTQTYTFISRKPDEVSRIYLFTAPFTLTSWICLVAAILVTAPVLYLINKLGPVSTLKSTGLLKITNCFWYIYGALLQQGGLYLPKADSGRVIIGVWWIVVIVIVTTYCGNLVAFLTFPKFQPGIEHLSQIFQHKDMKVFGLRNGTFFEKYSKQSSRNDFKQYMEKASLYNDKVSEDIGAVREGNRINIDWKINLQLAIQREYERTKGCDYMLAKETFVDEQIGLILPGNSPYLELVNAEIKRLHQMGFMERWHQIYMPANDKCTSHGQNRQITNHMVNLDDMQGCFLVLLFGFMISALFIAGEFWIYRLYSADKKRFELFAN